MAPCKISPDPDLCIHWCTCKVYRLYCSENAMKYIYILYQTLLVTHFISHWSTLSRAQDVLALYSGAYILYIIIYFLYIMVHFGIVWWWSLSLKSNGSAKRRLRFIGCTKRQPKSLNKKKAMSIAKLAKVSDKCVTCVSVFILHLRKKEAYSVSWAMILDSFLHLYFYRCVSFG